MREIIQHWYLCHLKEECFKSALDFDVLLCNQRIDFNMLLNKKYFYKSKNQNFKQ